MRLAKLSTMKVELRVPWTAGSARHSGAWYTVNPGANPVRSAWGGRMNMFRTNSACQALGVTNRTGSRVAWSAPPYRSWTKSSVWALRWSLTAWNSWSNCSGVIRSFLSHQIRPVDSGSSTMNLSLGLRPVCGVVLTTMAPRLVSWASLRRSECWYRAGVPRLAQTCLGVRPWGGTATDAFASGITTQGYTGAARPRHQKAASRFRKGVYRGCAEPEKMADQAVGCNWGRSSGSWVRDPLPSVLTHDPALGADRAGQ